MAHTINICLLFYGHVFTSLQLSSRISLEWCLHSVHLLGTKSVSYNHMVTKPCGWLYIATSCHLCIHTLGQCPDINGDSIDICAYYATCFCSYVLQGDVSNFTIYIHVKYIIFQSAITLLTFECSTMQYLNMALFQRSMLSVLCMFYFLGGYF